MQVGIGGLAVAILLVFLAAVKDDEPVVAAVAPLDRPAGQIANKLADERVGALPVVDADGKLIGIVSYFDALRALAP